MEVLNKLLETIEKNAIDNKVTIENVELFIKSWKKEDKLFKINKESIAIMELIQRFETIKSLYEIGEPQYNAIGICINEAKSLL